MEWECWTAKPWLKVSCSPGCEHKVWSELPGGDGEKGNRSSTGCCQVHRKSWALAGRPRGTTPSLPLPGPDPSCSVGVDAAVLRGRAGPAAETMATQRRARSRYTGARVRLCGCRPDPVQGCRLPQAPPGPHVPRTSPRRWQLSGHQPLHPFPLIPSHGLSLPFLCLCEFTSSARSTFPVLTGVPLSCPSRLGPGVVSRKPFGAPSPPRWAATAPSSRCRECSVGGGLGRV